MFCCSNHKHILLMLLQCFMSLLWFKWKGQIQLKYWIYMASKLNIYFIAKETMNSGLIPKILAYAGSVSIERTWRSEGKNIKRKVRFSDISNIGKALDDGWVITFPQGTTTPFKPLRKGTAFLIKQFKPVVVPIVIDGFRRSFDKRGLRIKKKNVIQKMKIKKPIRIDYENDTTDEIINKIAFSIEQHSSFSKV